MIIVDAGLPSLRRFHPSHALASLLSRSFLTATSWRPQMHQGWGWFTRSWLSFSSRARLSFPEGFLFHCEGWWSLHFHWELPCFLCPYWWNNLDGVLWEQCLLLHFFRWVLFEGWQTNENSPDVYRWSSLHGRGHLQDSHSSPSVA
jgi:hypothetical protein